LFIAAARGYRLIKSSRKGRTPMDILLVEDNEGDARLLRELLTEINKDLCIHVVGDGLEAMAFLRYQGPYLHVPRPDFILLDLHMPNMNGLEVLASVKEDPWLRTIPIIVLTSSDSEIDITQSYKLMANCYLRKPLELEDLEKLVRSLNDFWLTRVMFHKAGDGARPALTA
jgi:chemotaxis family two-component system response regulator Rcp1